MPGHETLTNEAPANEASANATLSVDDVRRQLDALGVQRGSVLVVHSSFRAVRPVEGGPSGLIRALLGALGAEGTLVMPSLTDWPDECLFDPSETPCLGMGVVADTFWRLPGVLRSDSPHSFAAYGPLAGEITRPHPAHIPHGPESPVGRVWDRDGFVLLLGVDHDANTTIHLAEAIAGVPYAVPKFCTVVVDGVPTRVDYGETDHCCRNFRQVGTWLQADGHESVGQVGYARARLARSREIVATAVAALKQDSCRFLCAQGSGCDECDEAWRSVARRAMFRAAQQNSEG